jgi:hypothetical protein
MKSLKWILAGLIAGVIIAAFRDFERSRWLAPAIPGEEEADDREPLLGYDGMDQETILEWLADSELDETTVESVIRYERSHLRREPVIEALEEMLS